MKRLPYLIGKKALADLDEIWLYTVETWSLTQADRYFSLIFDEIDHICEHPTSGKSMDHIRKGYRASKVKSHLVFYRVIDNTIEIIRILHEKMDIDSRLTE